MNAKLNIKTFAVAAIALMAMPTSAQTRYYDNIVLRQNGTVVYQNKAANVDSIAMEKNKTLISLYDKDGGLLYSTTAAGTRMDVEQGAPIADMLDLVFNEDGTATDISGRRHDLLQPDLQALCGTFRQHMGRSHLHLFPR